MRQLSHKRLPNPKNAKGPPQRSRRYQTLRNEPAQGVHQKTIKRAETVAKTKANGGGPEHEGTVSLQAEGGSDGRQSPQTDHVYH